MESNRTDKWLKRIFILLCFPVAIGSTLLTLSVVEELSWLLEKDEEYYETTKILVMQHNLMPGDVLSEMNVAIMSRSKTNLPSAFLIPQDFWIINGHKITYPIKRKEPITIFHTDLVESEESEFFHDTIRKIKH